MPSKSSLVTKLIFKLFLLNGNLDLTKSSCLAVLNKFKFPWVLNKYFWGQPAAVQNDVLAFFLKIYSPALMDSLFTPKAG